MASSTGNINLDESRAQVELWTMLWPIEQEPPSRGDLDGATYYMFWVSGLPTVKS